MIKADKYLRETLQEFKWRGQRDENPRPKYKDGTPAHTIFISQKSFKYSIFEGEFPINTLRNTAIKGGWYDIESIYIKQTNIIEEMHPSIWSWWEDFVVEKDVLYEMYPNIEYGRSIGQTYGHTVKRYSLVDKLLGGMEKNPFGRRHMINLWQEEQMAEDPKALVPCAYETLWTIRTLGDERVVDLTLNQRSMDYIMVSSINPTQYVMFGMAICNHLTFKTGIKHQLSSFIHNVQNLHYYERHGEALKELLEREPTGLQPRIDLVCEPKDFYQHTIEDFKFSGLEGIKPLSTKLELAV